MLEIGLTHYLLLAAGLFAIGIAVMATKRNAVGILIGGEMVLNAAAINFVACGRYRVGGLDGQIAAIFVIVLAVAGAAMALAILLRFYQAHATIDADEGKELRG